MARPPRPLRSEAHPEGIPEEIAKLSKKALKRLKDDTNEGGKFTLEHPGRSIALHLKKWKELMLTPGVLCIFYSTCMFLGSRRKKFQVLITNEKSFEKFIGKLCTGNHACSRSGLKHLKWRPTVSSGKVAQFQTGDEREYPLGFCQEYAKATKECLSLPARFVEVFSGPNAPLSHAVGEEFGVKREVQHLSQLLKEDIVNLEHPRSGIPLQPARRVESAPNRLTSVQAGRQPGYGKRTQLIPDGLQDSKLHLEEALKLEHPFSQEWALNQTTPRPSRR